MFDYVINYIQTIEYYETFFLSYVKNMLLIGSLSLISLLHKHNIKVEPNISIEILSTFL